MTKYLKVYTLLERWETFKESDVSYIKNLIDAIETMSQNPTNETISKVRELENYYEYEISELDIDDREVLEDMITRLLYQSQQLTKNRLTRWEFTLQRASDKGISRYFEALDDIINKSEKEMKEFSSSGSSPKEYVKKQAGYLDDLNEAWGRAEQAISENIKISPFYSKYFDIQVHKKRGVIERHIEYFQDNTFGEWLAGIRKEKGWSLAKAAEVTGVSSSYIHRIERGTRGVPSVSKLEQLASGYDIPTSEMVTMASGGIQSVDEFIEGGAFLVNGGIAKDSHKAMLAELIRLTIDGSREEAIEQLDIVRNVLTIRES